MTARNAIVWSAATLAITLLTSGDAAAQGAQGCAGFLDSFGYPDVALSAAEIKTGTDGAGEYCDIRGKIGGNVGFAIYLPTDWNGRFVMVGNGGKAGSISLDDMQLRVGEGFATASTDTGHDNAIPEQSGALFGKNVDMELDFAYRAVHDTADLTKRIIAAYYGRKADYSYWVGCSQGGRQGMMESQRFPTDFDGYVVGAPVYSYTAHQMTAPAAIRAMYGGDPATTAALFTPEEFKVIGDAVYAKCDALDGLNDGLLADPRQCKFDPAADLPQCQGGGAEAGCFSAEKIAALQALYGGTTNAAGDLLVKGVLPGSERMNGGWNTYYTGNKPQKHTVMDGSFEWMMFEEDRPDFDYVTDFDFEKDPPLLAYWAQAYDAVDPDLRDIDAMGQKMIMYHGFSDPSANPLMTIDYYQSVIDFYAKQGAQDATAEVNDFLRLYMIPGMGHCRGGVPGYNEVDFLSALMGWVEKGEAPGALTGTRPTDGATRIHCPFPEQAYNGSGDPNNAASFSCGKS
jgi:feruloyl esterase